MKFKTNLLLILAVTLSLTFLTTGCESKASGEVVSASTNITTLPSGIEVHDAKEALTAFLHFSFPGASELVIGAVAGGLLALLTTVARWLRKVIPDSWQTNKFGVALAHAASEVNPTVEKLEQAAIEAQLNKQK